ncbi:MAG: amidohydrolase family protein [Planctomycetota bacterium]
MTDPSAPASPRAANLLNLDYRVEAQRLGKPVVPILDAHLHVNGERAATVFRDVMDTFAIERCISMSMIDQAPAVKRVLGDRILFNAVPRFMSEDRLHSFTQGYLDDLQIWREEFGAGCMKIWNAPRWRMYARQMTQGQSEIKAEDLIELDSSWRIRHAERARELGMMIMIHNADPDTWFRAHYTDVDIFRTKAEQYESLHTFLERFDDCPVVLAHMGGSPEDLDFLDALLDRHDHLLLDTSATKWIVREVSKHPAERVRTFMTRWSGRILFGSDIVTHDDHFANSDGDASKFAASLAGSESEAWELYASRYYALRTLWETAHEGASPIADPDLMMVEPERYGELDSPALNGKDLGDELLSMLYLGAAERTMLKWYE